MLQRLLRRGLVRLVHNTNSLRDASNRERDLRRCSRELQLQRAHGRCSGPVDIGIRPRADRSKPRASKRKMARITMQKRLDDTLLRVSTADCLIAAADVARMNVEARFAPVAYRTP